MGNIEKQIEMITERAKLKAIIDELPDDSIAVLTVRREDAETGETELRAVEYGDGSQSDYLALAAFTQAVLYRDYFRDD